MDPRSSARPPTDATLRPQRERTASRLEADLHVSEGLFRSAFDHTHVAMGLTDLDNRLLRVNTAFARLFGCEAGELVGRAGGDLLHPDDREANHEHRNALIRGEVECVQLDQRYLHHSGRIIWGRSSVSLVHGVHGEARTFVWQVLDVTETRAAEAALRREREFVRAVLDTASDAFIAIDASGAVLDWNRRAEAVFGWPRAEALGRRVAELIIPNRFRPMHERGMQEFMRTGVGPALHNRLELPALRRDGSEISVELLIWPTHLGDAVVFNALLRDITKEKQARDALRASEARFRALVESASDAIFLFDVEGNVVDANRAAWESLGCDESELIGAHADAFVLQSELDQITQTARTGVRAACEGWHLRRSGTTFPVELRIAPIKLDGKPHALAVARDVAARKQGEEALREREELLRTVIAHIPCAVFWKDASSRFLGCNERFARDAGLSSPAQAVGKTDYDLFPFVPEVEVFRSGDRRVVATGEPIIEAEETMTQPSGGQTSILTSKVPLRDGNGAVVGVLGVYWDVTARKLREPAPSQQPSLIQRTE